MVGRHAFLGSSRRIPSLAGSCGLRFQALMGGLCSRLPVDKRDAHRDAQRQQEMESATAAAEAPGSQVASVYSLSGEVLKVPFEIGEQVSYFKLRIAGRLGVARVQQRLLVGEKELRGRVMTFEHATAHINLIVVTEEEGRAVAAAANVASKALWDAATRGDTDSVQALLADAQAVDVDLGWRDGEYEHSTPLHQSAYQNYTEIVRMLLAAGANPNAQDSYGYTPLIWCCENRQPQMQQAVSVARMLLEAGAEPDLAETYYGAGPLGWAAYYGKRELVALLLEFGASKDKRDFSGASALDSASTDEIRALLR